MSRRALRIIAILALAPVTACVLPGTNARQDFRSLLTPQTTPVVYQDGQCTGGVGMSQALRDADCRQLAENFRRTKAEEQKMRQDAIDYAQAQQKIADVKARSEATKWNRAFEDGEVRGYRRTDFLSAMLDSKQLAQGRALISVDGYYVKVGSAEYIFASMDDVMRLTWAYGQIERAIPVVTEDASRQTRERLLKCREHWVYGVASGGCRMATFGQMTMCRKAGSSFESPCLDLQFNWQPEG